MVRIMIVGGGRGERKRKIKDAEKVSFQSSSLCLGSSATLASTLPSFIMNFRPISSIQMKMYLSLFGCRVWREAQSGIFKSLYCTLSRLLVFKNLLRALF